MFLNILLITFVLLVLSMLAMALNILVKKKGKFPAYQVGHNKEMAKRGIKCVKHEEIACHKKKMAAKECQGCQQLAG